MKFVDMIKSSVLNEFGGTLSLSSLLLSLIVAFLIALFIIYIYKKTYNGVVYSRQFSLSLILLSMVTALVIKTINSNLALSLGMVGALSIVRFRTAIKEPIDTIFMFWSIAGGIMAGAGLYIPAIIATIALGILFFIAYLFGYKQTSRYLLVLKFDKKISKEIEEKLKELPKNKLRSKSLFDDKCELTFEIDLKNDAKGDIVNKFSNIKEIYTVSLINYQNDFGE